MGQVEIRRAVPVDAAAIRRVVDRAIRLSAAGVYPPDALDAWATGGSQEQVQQTISTGEALVAAVDGAIVGWAVFDGDEVDQLYVDPSVGGRGVARRLYEALEQRARANGLKQLTAVASLRAEPVFHRFGFTTLERAERRFNTHTFEVVHMAKRLDHDRHR